MTSHLTCEDREGLEYALEAFSALNGVSTRLVTKVAEVPGYPFISQSIWGSIVLGNQLFKGALQYGTDPNPDREYALCKAAFNACLGVGGAIAISYSVLPRLGLALAPGIATGVAMNWLMGRTTKDLYDDIHEALDYMGRDALAAAEYISTHAQELADPGNRTALLANELLDVVQNLALTAVHGVTPQNYNEAMQLANDFSRRMADLKGTAEAGQDELLHAMQELFGSPLGIPTADPKDFWQRLKRAGDLASGLVGDLNQWNELLHFLASGNWPGESYSDACALTAPKTSAPTVRTDPLVLDLDGDGIETTAEGRSWEEGRAFFDHNADGFAERTGWVSGNDGLLVWDGNGDGIINDGRELFGSGTALAAGGAASTGFQALADLDNNRDGIINANDALFSQLRIWKDEDEDGFSFPSELHTLSELGIASISLTPTAPGSGKDAQGNTQNRVGSFTWADGSSGQIAEYTFATNTAYSIATEWVDVPDEIAALPDLPGYGVVPRLQQAMARDTSGTLRSHVQAFGAATTRAGRESAMQNILYRWTGSSNIDPANGRDGLSGPRLGVLSAFFGQSFFPSGGSMRAVWASSSGVPASYLLPAASVVGAGTGVLAGSSGPWASGWGGATVAPSESYRQIFELMYSQLMAQTHLAGLWNLVAYTWDDTKEQYVSDMTPVISTIMRWFDQIVPRARQSVTSGEKGTRARNGHFFRDDYRLGAR